MNYPSIVYNTAHNQEENTNILLLEVQKRY